MTKGRLEAFSDGVFAIIITIMVLELKIPEGHDLHALAPHTPVFLSYVISYVMVGIYWNNHHHLLHIVEKIDARTMWTNLHLLFWLSLVPVTTAWVGEHAFEPWPTVLYAAVLFMAGIGWTFLAHAIVRLHGKDSELAATLRRGNLKGIISQFVYAAAIALAFVRPWLGQILIVLVGVMWFIPDPRIEQKMSAGAEH